MAKTHPKISPTQKPPVPLPPCDESDVLPVQTYVKVFGILLALIFVNMFIGRTPFFASHGLLFIGLMSIATIQAVLVCIFFMELIHENKFYSFIWGSAILFMMLFFVITLLELNGRGGFDAREDIFYMRAQDQNGNFAPEGPEATKHPAAHEEQAPQ